MKDFAVRLRESGMSSHEVQGKLALLAQCATGLASLNANGMAEGEPFAFFVPGRIEVLGKHTDYAGGRSLLCAIERGFAVLARPRDDARVRAVAVQRGETRDVSLDESIETEQGDWSNYLSTVVRRIARDFPNARRGMDIVFASDLPAASGMSSSSALVIAVFLALDAVNHLAEHPVRRQHITSRESLGEYLGAVENGRPFGPMAGGLGVGTLGGSQDQTAILCCRAGMLSRFSFCPVRSEGTIHFPVDRAFVLAYSGVAAEKTASARLRYNEASLAVVEILALWNAATSRTDLSLGDAVISAANAPDEIRAVLRRNASPDFTTQRLLDRFEQFVAEAYDIIPKAAAAFAHDNLLEIGVQVARSQHGVETLLGNQIPETIALTRLARSLGADAASAFGAGFGGSVWALVAAADADSFAARWLAAYRREFPTAAEHAEMIVTRPGPGAMQM
ncbi:MAG: galactokinase family protein [bacterium]